MFVKIPVSLGELVDKITILEIKLEKIKNKQKNKNINFELKLLCEQLENLNLDKSEIQNLKELLLKINLELWEIEDQIRILEKKHEFGSKFIKLARLVYKKNDLRFETKNKINILFSSEVIEEKSYEKY